jgi:hypothetical protein
MAEEMKAGKSARRIARLARALTYSARYTAGEKLREIAATEGISVERVRQLIAIASAEPVVIHVDQKEAVVAKEIVEAARPEAPPEPREAPKLEPVRPGWSYPDEHLLRLAHEARDELRANLLDRT